jgi:glutamine cyclotransferase
LWELAKGALAAAQSGGFLNCWRIAFGQSHEIVRPMRAGLMSLIALLAGAGGALAAPACPAPKPMHFQFERKIYRDVLGFTEGLEVHDHDIYESTGALGGGTRLLRITPQGHVTTLDDDGQSFFGEGLTFLAGRIYQLSWQDHKVFVYDLNGKLIRTMANPREGWGMTSDGKNLIFGDGSDQIFFTRPSDFAVTGHVTVYRGDTTVSNINELEYVDGKIYANIWMTRQIVRIDPRTGCIEAEAYMDPLWQHMTAGEQDYTQSNDDFVLNGIAYDPQSRLFYVTGKDWPFLFAGQFEDGEGP